MNEAGELSTQRREDAKPRPVPETENELAAVVVDAALEVHKTLGPGLLESAYVAALARELELRGLRVRREVPVMCEYKGQDLGLGFRIDLLVGDRLAVEVKASEALLPVHKAQLLSYLKLGNYRLGLIINFNAALLRGSIHRVVNQL